MVKLKNCPFCDEEAHLIKRLATHHVKKTKQVLWQIGCHTGLCPCWIPPKDSRCEDGYVSKKECIDNWQFRKGEEIYRAVLKRIEDLSIKYSTEGGAVARGGHFIVRDIIKKFSRGRKWK
jgi:hypothetical protein